MGIEGRILASGWRLTGCLTIKQHNMYRSHTNDRGRRDNGRRGSSYENDYYNNRNRDSWMRDSDRYEDDRYHRTNYGRREEDDYGPFSNIYSDENTDRRRDFDTGYNRIGNYYYDNRSGIDRSDEARGQSLSDIFSGGRRRSNSDREYFTSYRSGDDNRYSNDPHYSLYGSEDSSRYNRNRYNEDGRNFERYDRRDNDRYGERGYYRDDDDYRDLRNYSERDRSFSGDSTAFNKRRRYNEGYLY